MVEDLGKMFQSSGCKLHEMFAMVFNWDIFKERILDKLVLGNHMTVNF